MIVRRHKGFILFLECTLSQCEHSHETPVVDSRQDVFALRLEKIVEICCFFAVSSLMNRYCKRFGFYRFYRYVVIGASRTFNIHYRLAPVSYRLPVMDFVWIPMFATWIFLRNMLPYRRRHSIGNDLAGVPLHIFDSSF